MATFVAFYNIFATKRTLQKKASTKRNPYSYYQEQCLLFLPFNGDVTSNLQWDQTWHDIFATNNAIIKENMVKYNKILALVWPSEILQSTFRPSTSGTTFTSIAQGLLHHYAQTLKIKVDNPMPLFMVYTVKGAFNIGGTTIHLALHLPLMINYPIDISPEKLELFLNDTRT